MSETSRPRLQLSGTCACGAIRLKIEGPVISMLMCACEDCQKATGTGHSTVAMVRRGDFTVEGNPAEFARAADSGATFTRHFCRDCGTPLYGQSSRWPDGILVPVGFFGGETEWFAPNQLIFSRSLRHWDRIDEHLPRHETYRVKGAA